MLGVYQTYQEVLLVDQPNEPSTETGDLAGLTDVLRCSRGTQKAEHVPVGFVKLFFQPDEFLIPQVPDAGLDAFLEAIEFNSKA